MLCQSILAVAAQYAGLTLLAKLSTTGSRGLVAVRFRLQSASFCRVTRPQLVCRAGLKEAAETFVQKAGKLATVLGASALVAGVRLRTLFDALCSCIPALQVGSSV